MGGLLGGNKDRRADRNPPHAGHLARRHALRGAGAVHLASLIAVGVVKTLLAVWDRNLRTGAEAAGVQLAPMA